MTIAKSKPEDSTETITKVVQRYVPSAHMDSSVGVEVTYSLPSEDADRFEPMLSQIETDQSLNVVNYGISVTTLEEVFLK